MYIYTYYELSNACKSLLAKGPSFFPTPYDIDWCTLKQDFDNFVNKLRFRYDNAVPCEDNTTNSNDNNSEKFEIPPPKKVKKSSNFRLKTTRSHYLEAFIEKVE